MCERERETERERERERHNTVILCSVLRVKGVHEVDFMLVTKKTPNKLQLVARRLCSITYVLMFFFTRFVFFSSKVVAIVKGVYLCCLGQLHSLA